jgi:hypothetical protein
MNCSSDEDFHDSRLWQSLQRLGIGAIPVLPSNTALLKEWLLSAVREGGWSMADRAIASSADERSRDWRIAASEAVLIGTLRSPGTQEHLNWVIDERLYYQPYAKTQPRQHHVRQVAIYTPASLGDPGIHHVADVESFEFVDRNAIATPWPPRRNEQMVVYRLSPIRAMNRAIAFTPQDYMPAQGRWTTRLGLERARSISEVAMETEPEWRLLEWLQATRTRFAIRLDSARNQNARNPKGRAWFHLESGGKVRFDGVNGFLWRPDEGEQRFFTLKDFIQSREGTNLLPDSDLS